MKTATLTRTASTLQGTSGILQFGTGECRTLELPWKDNAKKISCVPTGSYLLAWSYSPHFGMCYHLLDVPGRSAVLIHPANFAGSVADGFTTQLEGCIAPCTKFGTMINKAGRMQLAGLISKPALRRFETWGAKESVTLNIGDIS